MGLLIDSSVLIAVERGRLDLARLLPAAGSEEVAVSAVTASELLHGVHRASDSLRRLRRERFVEAILAGLLVLPFDLAAARVHASLAADLARAGTPVGAHDLQIAATAIAVGYRIATSDGRSFPRIPGVEVLLWAPTPQ